MNRPCNRACVKHKAAIQNVYKIAPAIGLAIGLAIELAKQRQVKKGAEQ